MTKVIIVSSWFELSTHQHTFCLIVLSKDFVEGAVRLLVTRFIPFKPADLEGWQEDPEDWVNHEEHDNDMWEFEIRVRVCFATCNIFTPVCYAWTGH